MKYKSIIQTFLSRFLILFLNLGLLIFSTQIWGSEGKGIISILTADLAIISFASNIFSGSSVSYFASKQKKESVLLLGYLGSVVVGALLPLLFIFFSPHQYTGYLVGLSILSSLLSTHINFFVGQQKIKWFNLFSLLQVGVHLLFIVFFVFALRWVSIEIYFIAQMLCLGILFVISLFIVFPKFSFSKFNYSKNTGIAFFHYGWKTQLSAFLQFCNNRSSYYFLESFRGLSTVGIFSVGVALSEAIWTLSRSLALILYSEVVNVKNEEQEIISQTKMSLKISFYGTLACVLLVILIPSQCYSWVFGKDFQQTKTIFLWLSPGILAIAVSNIIGFYFAGKNELKILNVKSLVGLVFTLVASFFIIPKWGIWGACFITSFSYCLSSAVLLWYFYTKNKFSIHDFLFSMSEFKIILQKILPNK